MATNDTEVADLLSGYSGDKVPSFRFPAKGDKIVGTVTKRDVVDTTSHNDEKQKNLVLVLQTDEEVEQANPMGEVVRSDQWAVWMRSPSQMMGALAAELKAKGAALGSPRPGDRLAIEFFDSEPPSGPGKSPKKLYRVQFKPGVNSVVTSVDDLL